MKSSTTLLIVFVSLLISVGCKKEIADQASNPAPPVVKAAGDTVLILPYDRALLTGTVILNNPGDTYTVEWKKVDGVGIVSLENKNKLETRAMGFTAGEYRFELNVRDQFGNTAKDTMRIVVNADPHTYTKETVFDDLDWQCPMGCSVTINLNSIDARGQITRVYLKTATGWVVAFPDLMDDPHYLHDYHLYFDNESMTIYANDDQLALPSSVKVEY